MDFNVEYASVDKLDAPDGKLDAPDTTLDTILDATLDTILDAPDTTLDAVEVKPYAVSSNDLPN